ncbi:exonuclease domain-containing protein [Janibacter terrae]|uniref:exonuclease domain-containing protein n=1 Tax=Janibacter terrae TaxID=103817 RepID=UPI000830629F|nr:exonuclease domain-containing protein [Janibacter terrae]
MIRWRDPGGGSARRREAAARRAPAGPLRDHLAVPPPSPDTPVAELPLLALDLETTGLDAGSDRIVAMAWVPVDGPAVDLGGARRLVVAADAGVGESATVHGLTDDAVAAGQPEADALTELLAALTGRVLLAHHDSIETTFLAAACDRVFAAPFATTCVDTLDLQRRVLAGALGTGPEPRAGELRLQTSRERFGLPRYRPHDPLADALGCAELYLAQVAELAERVRRPLTLKTIRAR